MYMATKHPAWQCMWYLGRIVVVHEDDTYDIEYDDGDSEQRVARKNIKESDAPRAATRMETGASASESQGDVNLMCCNLWEHLGGN